MFLPVQLSVRPCVCVCVRVCGRACPTSFLSTSSLLNALKLYVCDCEQIHLHLLLTVYQCRDLLMNQIWYTLICSFLVM